MRTPLLALVLTLSASACTGGTNDPALAFCGQGGSVDSDGGPNDLLVLSADGITCPGAMTRVEGSTTICLWECAQIDGMFYRVEVFLPDELPAPGECLNSPGGDVTKLDTPCTPTN